MSSKTPAQPATPTPNKPPSSDTTEPSLSRATTPLPGEVRAAHHLGFRLEPLRDLYALAGEVSTPPWSSPTSSEVDATRDDDLDTSWTCTATDDKPCAVSIAFGQPSTVHAVRLYGAAGFHWLTYRNHPRVHGVRVHTDAGHGDAELDDGAAHRYVVFEPPIKTEALSLEIRSLHKGKKDAKVHIAELEVYGSHGPAREPLELDAEALIVHYETEAWKPRGDERHIIRQVFVEQLLPSGATKRLLRGTAAFTHPGDRLVLVEKLFNHDCDATTGSYVLLDTKTRVPMPLGELGGGAPVIVERHPEGRGWSTLGHGTDSELRGIVVGHTGVDILRPSERSGDDSAEPWGFTDLPTPRGGSRLDEPPEGCVRGRDDPDALEQASVVEHHGTLDPSAWVVCALRGADESSAEGEASDEGDSEAGPDSEDASAKLLVGTGTTCGKRWSIIVLGPDGRVVAEEHGKPQTARGVRLRAHSSMGWLVETSRRDGDRTTLWRVDGSGIHRLLDGAGFAVRSPARCNACDDRFAVD